MDILQDYWQILSAFVVFVIAFITLKVQNENQEKRLNVLEKKVEDMTPIWAEIKERLASIEATLQFLTKGMK